MSLSLLRFSHYKVIGPSGKMSGLYSHDCVPPIHFSCPYISHTFILFSLPDLLEEVTACKLFKSNVNDERVQYKYC
jgi:hypothetical protein